MTPGPRAWRRRATPPDVHDEGRCTGHPRQQGNAVHIALKCANYRPLYNRPGVASGRRPFLLRRPAAMNEGIDMSILRRFKIKHRLSWLILVVLAGSLATIGVTLHLLNTQMMAEKEQQTRKLVETAYSLVASYEARVGTGELSTAQAQQAALDALRVLRYDGGNYFWVNDMQPRMVMHPIKPDLDGRPLGEMRDPAGTRLFQDMVDVVRDKGAGIVPYQWAKPGHKEPVPKVSFVKGFPAWDWVIGSGIYVDDVAASFWQVATRIGVIALLVLALVVAGLYLIGRSIVRPICLTSDAMREVAFGDGDLTHQLPTEGNDEVTQLTRYFNEFVAKTRRIVAAVGESTAQLATAAEELSAVTRANSTSAASQRSETDQVATAVTEMNVAAQEVARNAAETAEAARQTDEAAAAGREVMARAVGSMQQLTGEIDTAAGVIDNLKKESENIGAVLGVIRGVAEQTNLLALNAAIEAARAGEQGRGFAVVADEVRTLASRTQQSTEEIQEMIERLQNEAGKAVRVMETGRGQTHQTLEHAAGADQALANIVQLIDGITGMTTQIASAAEEQTGVSNELDRNVAHIASLADQTVGGSEQIEAASGELARLGEGLRELVSQFKT